MKTTECKLKYDADGYIDYVGILNDGLLEGNILSLKKYESNNKEAILSNESMLKYSNGLKKKDWICHSIKEKEKIEKDEKELIEEEQETIIIKPPKKSVIKRRIDDIINSVKNNPDLQSEIINVPNKQLSTLGQTDWINTYNVTNRWGKVVPILKGNTRTGSRIIQLKEHNFGSIVDYDIDTKPHSIIKMKGQEVYTLSNIYKQTKNKVIISRRFAGNILSYWCYALGIRYNSHKDEKCGIEEWCDLDTHENQPLISGNDLKEMVRDIIYLTRDNKPERMFRHIKSGKCSFHLYNVVKYLIKTERKRQKENGGEFKTIEYLPYLFNQIKDRLYYDFNIGKYAWCYPKYSVEYLLEIIDEFNSGKYLMDIAIPIVLNQYTSDGYRFPLKNSDVHIHPISNEEHEQAKDDYDLLIYQHDWER